MIFRFDLQRADLILRDDSGRNRCIGGGDRTRTRYLLLAKQPLSQLSYTPKIVPVLLGPD